MEVTDVERSSTYDIFKVDFVGQWGEEREE